ncbi:tyrosine-type recombinase/integrase [Micromonospora carbonacea]|uniref:Site-specific recombinase XerD n=1 Tax=Micromonospora carbonacea TaxID=47853 RepID=A0A1C5AMG5_9ACTN|nr:site-specific integrase [Micromonospora carbonacea]SCF46399.1 Site-specific recombinase XerD [Micromonospora carbonacea]
MPRKQDPIKKVTLKDGRTRYRFVIDVGRRSDGGRDQRTYTYDTLREAKAERAKIIAGKSTGTYVAPSTLTLGEYLPAWLAGKRNLRAGALRAYGDALKPVVERLGDVEVQKLRKADLDGLVDWMLTSGRRVGNVQKQSLSPRSVCVMLTVLSGALDSAEKQGLIVRNVAKLVERPTHRPKALKTWTAEQAMAFLTYVAEDRLYAAWCLSLYGLRRGEVVGLRWDWVDLTGESAGELGVAKGTPTITIHKARVSVAGEVFEEDPKSERGRRTLPLDATLVAALKTLKARQAAERLEAGAAYERSGLVVVNELGRPPRPEWYGDRFQWLAAKAGLPVIRLHDARHTCGTLMHLRGVPTAVISAWLGHASAAFTLKTYVHSQDGALHSAGATLMQALTGVEPAAPVAGLASDQGLGRDHRRA